MLCILKNTIPQRLSARQGRIAALRQPIVWTNCGLITSEAMTARTHPPTPATSAPSPDRRRGLAARPAHRAQPAVRRQRAAHRPDGRVYIAQVTGSQISALDRRHRQVETDQRQGRRHHRARRRRLRRRRQPLRHRGDGRPGERARHRRPHPRAARRPAVRQRHHRAPGPAVHRRMPRGRPADGTRPRQRRASGSCWRTCRPPTRWRSAPTGCLYYPVMARQRDLADRPRRR